MVSVTIMLDGYGYSPCKVTFTKREDGSVSVEAASQIGVPFAGVVVPPNGLVIEWMTALFS